MRAANLLGGIESELVLVAEAWLERYGRFDVLVRQLLWWRAFWDLAKRMLTKL